MIKGRSSVCGRACGKFEKQVDLVLSIRVDIESGKFMCIMRVGFDLGHNGFSRYCFMETSVLKLGYL